jgi:hypothetical protein
MEELENIDLLAEALSLAQGEMKAAVFNRINPYFKSKYADLGSVIESLKLPFANHGLSYTQIVGCDGKNVTVETILMHKSGQYVPSTMTMPLDPDSKNSIQAMGSTITYMRRYSLGAISGVYVDDDLDGSRKDKSTENRDKELTEVDKVHKDIVTLCKDLGGQKNKVVMELVKTYVESGNTNTLDLEKSKELYTKLIALNKNEEK